MTLFASTAGSGESHVSTFTPAVGADWPDAIGSLTDLSTSCLIFSALPWPSYCSQMFMKRDLQASRLKTPVFDATATGFACCAQIQPARTSIVGSSPFDFTD